VPAPRVELHAGAQLFLEAAEPFLRSDPFSTNVPSVVAARIAMGQESDNGNNVWATVTGSGDRVVGVAMHTPPHPVFVSRMPADGAASVARALATRGRAATGVNGALEATRPFASTWLALTGDDSVQITAMRLYRLDTLVPPPGATGHGLVAASAHDVDLMTNWLAAFHDEVQTEAPRLDWQAIAERRVRAGEVHFWEADGVIVALAGVSASALGVSRVGPVYTPPAHRRHGFGAAVTAHATASAVAGGAKHVVLYTDLANPTSNSIYQKIGFVAEHDAEERLFVRPGEARTPFARET